MRIVFSIEYDGSSFCGWQHQPSGCSIQDVIQKAIKKFTGKTIKITGSSRTDSGVHASWQIFHFDTNVQREMNSWVRGVNAFLPTSIKVLGAFKVNEDFHARFSAMKRQYNYLLYSSKVSPCLFFNKVGWTWLEIDETKLKEAIKIFMGKQDFSSFRSSECQSKSPVREMFEVNVDKISDSYYIFKFVANSFLHHMIRNIIGSLIYVASGKQSLKWLIDVKNSKNRTLAAPTFSSSGLYLSGVYYEKKWKIPFNNNDFMFDYFQTI